MPIETERNSLIVAGALTALGKIVGDQRPRVDPEVVSEALRAVGEDGLLTQEEAVAVVHSLANGAQLSWIITSGVWYLAAFALIVAIISFWRRVRNEDAEVSRVFGPFALPPYDYRFLYSILLTLGALVIFMTANA